MIYNYYGLWRCASKCDIEVYGNVVVATELEDNPGTSITNFAAELATMICKEYRIPMCKLIWIEHYPERENFPESYSIVNFEYMDGELCFPEWKYISKEKVWEIIEDVEEHGDKRLW